MSSLETLREFLGWCTVINMGVLIIVAIFAGPLRGAIAGIHAKMFGALATGGGTSFPATGLPYEAQCEARSSK